MIKIIITTFMALIGCSLYSQNDCNIFIGYTGDTMVFHNDTTICFNTRLRLFTQFDTAYNYLWEPGGQTGVIFDVTAKDTTTYILHVVSHDSTFICTDSVTIGIYPKVIITFEQLVFGCPPADSAQADTICKAQVKANVTGGYPPYHYNWGDSVNVNYGDSTWALDLCVKQSYTFIVY